MSVVLLAYLIYLPNTSYWRQYYDAAAYWNFGTKYYTTGHFDFESYTTLLRGYLFPLLLSPLTQLTKSLDWTELGITQVVGAGVAAAFFGGVAPALWQAVRGGAPVPLGRRLLFAGFGFLLWRDYFNFSLTDFPALLALAVALIGLLRGRGFGSSLLAGLALAAAVNLRPVYQAALPAVGLLALLPPPGRARWWGVVRGGGLALGLALLLLPQVYINYQQIGSWSPWVLTNRPEQPNLFLQQLAWGLEMQKYETSVGVDYPRAEMIFKDDAGLKLLQSTGRKEFDDVGQYVRLCLSQPGTAGGVWLRHLFNGLDVQYPTPYITEVFVLTWPLAWLNYSLIGGGGLILLGRRWRRPGPSWARPALVVLALLIPCAVTLITAMECRFLLPLHLLLSAAVAFGASPRQWWRARSRWGRAGVVLSYGVVVLLCFWISAGTQRQLALVPREIKNDFLIEWPAPRPAPQPW